MQHDVINDDRKYTLDEMTSSTIYHLFNQSALKQYGIGS